MKNLLLAIFCLFCGISNAQTPDAEWWTFNYPKDKSLDSGLLNLRYLNEKYAGANGFICLSEDGNSLVDGKGRPVRFWACNGGDLSARFDDKQLDTFARFLAKLGVNLIRFHGAINPHGKNSDLNVPDSSEIDHIWRCVATMKKYGIYTTISPFWPHNGHMGGWVPEEWGIEGYSGKDDLWAVLYFNKKLQRAYESWAEKLYTMKNPYTGIALKDEPAVALIQIENEDAVFFWTMSGIKPELAKMVGLQFGAWLKKKYGSLEKAQSSWKNIIHPDDRLSEGTLGLYPIYEMTQPPDPKTVLRLKDQVEFYAETQKSFYDRTVRFYRNDLGCKQLINANNWRTASQSRLLDLERWTNSGADVIAVNKYFDPKHHGPNSGWRVDPGDDYGAPSALKHPEDLPTNIKHLAGHPMMVTESAWNLPNKYQTEGPLLVAAYGGLSGLDAYFWFNPSSPTYASEMYFTFLNVKGQHPMNRWSISIPGQMGMFPANALIARLGYVKEASALFESRTMESMLNREIPVIFEEQSFDPNRDFETRQLVKEQNGFWSPLTFLTGNVSSDYATKENTLTVNPKTSQQIHRSDGHVRSLTGEQDLDYRNGIFILNTPKAKGISGFLNKKKDFDLGDVRFSSSNEYATIQLVSLDSKEISASSKLLLQVGTLFRPTGWEENPIVVEGKPNRFQITNTGKMPWLGMPAKGQIHIKNLNLHKATRLDAAGYKLKQVPLDKDSTGVRLVLPNDAFYIIIEQ